MIDKQRGNIIKMDRHRSPRFFFVWPEKKQGKLESQGLVSLKRPLSRHPCANWGKLESRGVEARMTPLSRRVESGDYTLVPTCDK